MVFVKRKRTPFLIFIGLFALRASKPLHVTLYYHSNEAFRSEKEPIYSFRHFIIYAFFFSPLASFHSASISSKLIFTNGFGACASI